MRRFWLLSAAILLPALLLFAVLFAPARLVAWSLPASQASGAGYSGTLWNGRVASLAVATPAGPLQLGSVRWQVVPASLLTLAPTVRWQSRWGSQQVQGRVRWLGGESLLLDNLEFGVDAGLLRRFLPVKVSGRFTGLLSELSIRDGRLNYLRGQVTWGEAAWRDGDRRFSLGSYAVEFTPDAEGGTEGKLLTLDGPLLADGELSLARDGAFAVALALKSEQPLAQPLERALSLMAAPAEDGFRLQLEGNLYPTSP